MSVVAEIDLIHTLSYPPSPDAKRRAREAVGRGARLLDENIPGWPLLVSEPLQMRSASLCVLGQIGRATGMGFYGDVAYALLGDSSVRMATDVAMNYGFTAPVWDRAVTQEWTRVINERRVSLRH